MAPDGLTRAVRRRLGLGRLLPLGEASDGAWLAEKAAGPVLREAVAGITGVSVGALRIGLADPDAADEPAVPPPPGALPPGPLRVVADLTATAGGEPLPHRAERLRIALREAASARLGLVVTAVDLRVTDLVEAGGEPVTAAPPD
ncbi:nucleopolyhedrovirus P10 family protein, partial [Streptomyces albidochromogenes]